MITGSHPGTNDPRIQAWASSPEGIGWALDRIASVAAGKRGSAAVNAIVRQFERPANPDAEVQRALAGYGGQIPAPTAPVAATAPTQPQTGNYGALNSILAQLLDQPSLAMITAPSLPSPAQAAVARHILPGLSVVAPTGPRTLAVVPARIATHGGINIDARVLPAAAQIAQQFGVKVNSGYRSAQHNAEVGGASQSDHLRGDAIDFTGTRAQMQSLYRWAQGKFPYVEPWSQTGGSHVHISFSR